MPLQKAMAVIEEMQAALATEIENARNQRQLLHSFDGERLLDMAAQRERFNQETATLQRRLAEALAFAGQVLSLKSVTVESLLQAQPVEGRQLAKMLGEVRALAAALAELDALNQVLAEKALACVRAYTQAVQPNASAYDRRGSYASGSTSTLSQRI